MKDEKKQTILIVDDSRTNIMALADLLKDVWAIKIATNGKDALRIAFSEDQPDLILLDVMMPDMDGYEVCKRLKAAPETKHIPIVFVTAMNQAKDEEYGLSLGAIDYITKPISPPIVKARVNNHLELKRYRDLLKENSMVDGLTGVANRRRFDEAIELEWRRALRYEHSLSLLMVDIDYFKRYNDTYGHLEGDECLRKVAITLKQTLKRPLDMLARWGGEEFACLLPDTDAESAFKVAEQLRKAIVGLQLPHESSPISEYVTVSIGVATVLPNAEMHREDLFKQSDEALYKAKENGRNQIFMG
ncbi:diguanylate cyclase [Desulfuribacillus alkaliarsenatis]|uniref:Diguanylate cyclase response regulator n=1 Tax=Desulfuribacillus alkaliarsenatis TaxID=766136 RepID=A0A1E5G0T8_9FIRM|nr:diguanylate cyclase [Desulfuribacillus alkaliarsenatis]OEF96528.1 diguanylate cyclase response regulator [Desulfuribacillus alkaliarsenatis]